MITSFGSGLAWHGLSVASREGQRRGFLIPHLARQPTRVKAHYWNELRATDDVFYFTVAGGHKHVGVFHVRPPAIIAPISLGVGFHPRARIWAERASMRSQKPGGNWPWSTLDFMGVGLPTARQRLVVAGAFAQLATTRFGHIYGLLACAVLMGPVIR